MNLATKFFFSRKEGHQRCGRPRRGGGDEKRATAARVTAWCDVILSATKGQDYIKKHADTAAKVSASAARIADYKGSFVLRLLVGPFAEVTNLTR